MKIYATLLFVFGLSAVPAAAQDAIADEPAEPKVTQHLDAEKMDLPSRFKMESQSGMKATLRDHDGGVDVLLAFGGYRHFSGAVRLTRILFRFPRGKRVLCLSDSKPIYYDRGREVEEKTVDCLKGYLVVDREQKKIEIDCVVFDNGDWHRFGWNGVWDIKLKPNFDTEGLFENMGIAVADDSAQ
ncbi:hypothetical protein FHS27_006594 [Rhodopirellula rubra]|uniref:Uncharacterized protein n=1 Tax=Aporhodopirellula rubra TaxID=980271 RepID=A0A7W5E5Q1_9BACT|nr:hypothetical protein [Aporhodopirellula rubra]MBB3210746.1 hypothetical protein [Aporhodopirellula rubra]